MVPPVAPAWAVCYPSSSILFRFLSRGARRPGCRGIMAKPVRVRRCRATVTRSDRCTPGQLSQRGINQSRSQVARLYLMPRPPRERLPDFAMLPFTARPESVSSAARLPDGNKTVTAAISPVGPSGSALHSRVRDKAPLKDVVADEVVAMVGCATGLLKTCRRTSGDFPPRMLREVSPL